MDGAVEGAGSCDEPAPEVKRSSMFRRYQAEVMAARANTQVRRSSELVKKHRMAEAIQLAAEAAAEAAQLAAEAEAEAAAEAAEEAAAEAAQRADRAAEHAADQAAGQAADQVVAHQADVREGPSGVTQRLLERARTEAPIAAEEMTLEAAPSVRVAAVEMWTEAAPSVRVAAVEGSISTRTALAEVEPTRPGAAPPAPPPPPPPATAASKQAAPHPPEPLAQGEAQPAVQDDLHQRDNYRDELAVTQLSSSGSVHVLARGNANGGED